VITGLLALAALAAPLDVERSKAWLEAGRMPDAREAAERALIENPEDWEAATAYAAVLEAQGADVLVLPELDAIAAGSVGVGVVRDAWRVAQGSASPDVLKGRPPEAADLAAYMLAVHAMREGAPAVALSTLGTPNDPWEQALALDALLTLAMDGDAGALAKRIGREHPDRPDAWAPLFATTSTSGPVTKARKAALKAADGIVASSRDPVLVYRARRLFVAAGEEDRTKAAAEALVRLGEPAPLPRPPWSAAMRKALSRGLAMQTPPALPEATPDETRDLALRVALALREMGRVKDAIGVFEAARATADSVELALAHGEQLMRMGKPDAALVVAKEAKRLAVEPADRDVGRLNLRGTKAELSAALLLEATALAASGRPDEAIESASAAALLDPSAEAWAVVGELYAALGWPEAAFSAFAVSRWRGGRVEGRLESSWTGLGDPIDAADAIAVHAAAEFGEAAPDIADPATPRIAVGEPSPPWRLDTDRGPIGWDSTQGKVVVVAFFASWCGPCRLELPKLAQMARAMTTEEVAFVAVSLDERSQDYTRLLSEIDLEGLYVGWDPELGHAWNVRSLPTTWMVDRKAILRDIHQGYAPGSEKELEEQIRKLLREP